MMSSSVALPRRHRIATRPIICTLESCELGATDRSRRAPGRTQIRVFSRGRRNEPENLVLARPSGWQIEHTRDADPVWQPALDRGLDQGRSEKRKRDRHIDVALAAVLADSDVLHVGNGA